MPKACCGNSPTSRASVCMVRATARVDPGLTAVPTEVTLTAAGVVPDGGGHANGAPDGGHAPYSSTVTS
jgi:hypothetical protein